MKYLGLAAAIGLFLVFAIVGCRTTPANTSSSDRTSLTGHWDGSWQFQDGSYAEKFSLDLTDSGETIIGTGVDEKKVAATVTGKRQGSDFNLQVAPENKEPAVTFYGKLEDNSMAGMWMVGRSTGPWSAKRKD